MKCPTIEVLPSGSQGINVYNASNNPVRSSPEHDFSEYMWMGEELDAFDKQVNDELEQDFIEFCMIECDDQEDQEGDWFSAADYEEWKLKNPEGSGVFNQGQAQPLVEAAANQQLNPDAAEFVPRCIKPTSVVEQER